MTTDEVASEREQPADDSSYDALVASRRRRDAEANEGTRLPDDERVTLRSVSTAECYTGRAIDDLVARLDTLEWSSEELLGEAIKNAIAGSLFSGQAFWLWPLGTSVASLIYTQAAVQLPDGVKRAHGTIYVLGPALVVLALTFILDDEQAGRFDSALREDAETVRTPLPGGGESTSAVHNEKSRRLRQVWADIRERCLQWVAATLPGNLSLAESEVTPPTYATLSLKQGVPFGTHAGYMALLGLVNDHLARRFTLYESVYLSYPLSHEGAVTLSFNEHAADDAHLVQDLDTMPEVLHELVDTMLVLDGIYALLETFGRQLRRLRGQLNGLDLNGADGRTVVDLRNELLTASREVASVCGDLTVLSNQAVFVWSEVPLTVPLVAPPPGTPPEGLADARKRQLRAAIDDLRNEESNLRELMLVTSAAMSDTVGLRLQERIRSLTIWLVVLTVLLLGLGVATLVIQATSPTVQVHVPQPIVRVQLDVPKTSHT